MIFQEPKMEFVSIDMKVATSGTPGGCGPTSSNPSSCDDTVMSDMEICTCYGSPSEVVTIIS